jgi:putative colanic acid biosynthesis acetyltransferase WcaF
MTTTQGSGRRAALTRRPRPSLSNKLARGLWGAVWLLLFRPSPRIFHGWRRVLLRAFGARIASGALVYPSARIWAPWNLEMGAGSTLGDGVDCYSVDKVILGPRAVVSQRAYLCTASRDIDDPGLALVTAPIVLERRAWVTAEVFVGPGVTLEEGAVAAARSVVTRSVRAWTVVGGNPARPIGARPPVED